MSGPEAEPVPPAAEPAAAKPAAAPALPSPGALLRQARERAGLGAEDLAGQLKLAKGTLEALERDDFAALSEPVYIRGYYRKIAKVLPIAESELIDAYNARTHKPSSSAVPIRRLPLAGGVAAGTSRHAQGPGVGTIVAIIVGIGILIAVATREPPQRLAPPATPEPAAAPAAPAEQPAAASPGTPAASPAEGTVAAPAATPSPAATPAAAAPAAAPNQLVLEFRDASFVRVEDARGKTLAIGLVRGGERHALDGAPPYTVFLGTPQNVNVFYGGAAVDFSAHVNAEARTARFTVP